jgi:hypothetical protein
MFPSGFSAANSNVEIYIVGAGEYGQDKQGSDKQRQVNLIDNLFVVKRRHELKFGVDYRRLFPFSSPAAYARFAEFAGVTTRIAQPGTKTPGRSFRYGSGGVGIKSVNDVFALTLTLEQNVPDYGARLRERFSPPA